MLPLLLVDWTLAELFDLSTKALAGVLERGASSVTLVS